MLVTGKVPATGVLYVKDKPEGDSGSLTLRLRRGHREGRGGAGEKEGRWRGSSLAPSRCEVQSRPPSAPREEQRCTPRQCTAGQQVGAGGSQEASSPPRSLVGGWHPKAREAHFAPGAEGRVRLGETRAGNSRGSEGKGKKGKRVRRG